MFNFSPTEQKVYLGFGFALAFLALSLAIGLFYLAVAYLVNWFEDWRDRRAIEKAQTRAYNALVKDWRRNRG